MVDFSIKPYSGAIATLFGGALTYTGIVTFLKGEFTRAFTDWNFIDLIFVAGVALFLFAIILMGKDIIDGHGWSREEKKRAAMGFGIGILLVVSAWAIASIQSSYVLQDPIEDQFNSKFRYTGGTAGDVAMTFTDPQYLSIAGGVGDNTALNINFNQTGFTFAFLRTIRGINMTLTDDGITTVVLYYYSGSTSTKLLGNVDNPTQFEITDLGTTTSISINWSLSDVLTWVGAYKYSLSTDKFYIQIGFGTDYDDSVSQTITWNWVTTNDSDAVYYLVWFIMTVGLMLPFMYLIGLINNVRMFSGNSYRKYKSRRYNRKHKNYGKHYTRSSYRRRYY